MAQERAQGNGQLEEEVVELLTVVSQKRESVLARAKVRLREASGFIALAAFIVAVLAAATLFWSNIRENINQEIVQSEQHTSGRIDRMEQRLSGDIQDLHADFRQFNSTLINNLLLISASVDNARPPAL